MNLKPYLTHFTKSNLRCVIYPNFKIKNKEGIGENFQDVGTGKYFLKDNKKQSTEYKIKKIRIYCTSSNLKPLLIKKPFEENEKANHRLENFHNTNF